MLKRRADTDGGGGNKKIQRCRIPSVPGANPNSNGKSCKMKVYVRLRPLKPTENPDSQIIQVLEEEPKTMLIFDPKVEMDEFYFKNQLQKMRDINKKIKKNLMFEFDEVFPPNVNNQQVFNSTVKSVIASILEGFNCSVFAYGATGAGKTFTMLGKEDSPGISYLTIKLLLELIEKSKDKLKISLYVSYIEVYNEEVRDLLSPGGKKLDLREEAGSTYIAGLKLIPITDADELFALLESGNRQRTQHPTDSNAESSRSHAVFQVRVQMQEKSTGGRVKVAKLTMIDLAGSERGCATGFKGKQFKEGRAINQSLLALGNCINALADNLNYVPYRDSKLTRILKDSLGGNCQTIMIANISPSPATYDETYNTLKYATRARSIITTANQNFLRSNLSIGQYSQLANELKTKLSKTEAEKSELNTWSAEAESVMNERLKLFSECMALESQKKITEWRLNKAIDSQNLVPKDYLSERLANSVEQWRKRVDVLSKRIEEFEPKIRQNIMDFQKLVDSKDQACKYVSSHTENIYNLVLSSWQMKVKIAYQEIENQHIKTINKLLTKNDEILSTFRDETIPVYNHCYQLLKAGGLVTGNLKNMYETSMKKLQEIKYVSWESEVGEEEANPSQVYYSKLSEPGTSVPAGTNDSAPHRVIVPAGGGLARLRYMTPKKNNNALRTIQPTSRSISRLTKSPKPKVLQQMISNLNKENIAKDPTAKKKLNIDPTGLGKRKTPIKTSSLTNLRTAV